MFSENVFCVSKKNCWAETSTGHGRKFQCPFALLFPLCLEHTGGWEEDQPVVTVAAKAL